MCAANGDKVPEFIRSTLLERHEVVDGEGSVAGSVAAVDAAVTSSRALVCARACCHPVLSRTRRVGAGRAAAPLALLAFVGSLAVGALAG